MQDIEPFYHWRDEYTAENDRKSPFYRKRYNEFQYHNVVYNFYIHPQWDEFGSATLYLKLLYADYEKHYAIIELIGEWNDALYNDIMYLKRNFADHLIESGIYQFILIADNVLNYHGDDNSYYEEWIDDLFEYSGWIVCINVLEHVGREFHLCKTDKFLNIDDRINDLDWRLMKPEGIYIKVKKFIDNKLKSLY